MEFLCLLVNLYLFQHFLFCLNIDPLHLTSQCYASLFGWQNITLERTCLCKTDGTYWKRYLILKMNYKINMHFIDFKIAHLKVQALAYLVQFAK